MRGRMKKILLYSILVGSLLTLSMDAWAWKVTVKNDTSYAGTFFVKGEHLFWVSDDCHLSIDPGKSQDCSIAYGICPAAISWSLSKDGRGINNGDTTRGAKCWDSNFRLYYENGQYKWEWK